jgi:hypothetical protein
LSISVTGPLFAGATALRATSEDGRSGGVLLVFKDEESGLWREFVSGAPLNVWSYVNDPTRIKAGKLRFGTPSGSLVFWVSASEWYNLTGQVTEPENLEELAEVLRGDVGEDDPSYAKAFGLKTCESGAPCLDWFQLPAFGRRPTASPRDATEQEMRYILSWDADRLLIGEYLGAVDIVTRQDWKAGHPTPRDGIFSRTIE